MSKSKVEITTYADLLQKLQKLSAKQLSMPVQVVMVPPTLEPAEICPAIAFGTVGQLEISPARSSVDNKYHANEPVIQFDYNPFAVDGAIAYESKPGKLGFDIALYPSSGPTKLADQRSSVAPKDKDMSVFLFNVLKRRMQDIHMDAPVKKTRKPKKNKFEKIDIIQGVKEYIDLFEKDLMNRNAFEDIIANYIIALMEYRDRQR